MRKNYFLSVCAVLLFAGAAFSQNPCGTFEESKWLDHYFEHKNSYTEADTPWLYVPTTMFIVGNDQGGGYFRKKQVFDALCNLNEQYVPARIHYYLHPTQPFIYLDNSEWYEHGWDGGSDMIQSNYISNRLCMFIVSDPAGNCGYSWQDAIVMGKGCSGARNSTWAHEAGHHFSLPHTFRGWEGNNWDWSTPAPAQIGNRQVEKADGSNCAQGGDRFCDTEPDYISNRWSCNANARSFSMLDPDGVEIRADGTLFMSYANDECQNRFSGEQIDAMRANLQSEHSSYLVVSEEGPSIDQAVNQVYPADSATINAQGEMFTWDAVPNAEYYLIEMSLFSDMRTAVIVSEMVEGTSYELTANLPLNRFLYWRVRPYSQWSFCDLDEDAHIKAFKIQNLSATNELESKATASLSPNPIISGQALQMTVNSTEAFDAQLNVFDVNGRQLQSRPVRLYEGESSVSIQTYGLTAGMYRAVLQNEKGNIQKVFSIVR